MSGPLSNRVGITRNAIQAYILLQWSVPGGPLPVQMRHPCGDGTEYGFVQIHAFMNVGGKGVQKVESEQNKVK